VGVATDLVWSTAVDSISASGWPSNTSAIAVCETTLPSIVDAASAATTQPAAAHPLATAAMTRAWADRLRSWPPNFAGVVSRKMPASRRAVTTSGARVDSCSERAEWERRKGMSAWALASGSSGAAESAVMVSSPQEVGEFCVLERSRRLRP